MVEKLRLPAVARLERLTIAGARLGELIEAHGQPVLQLFEFFVLVEKLFAERSTRRLYLRASEPDLEECQRLRRNLTEANLVASDRDYGSRVIRVLGISDVTADQISTMLDPTCCISHLSAMQRWGLTNRRPKALHLTRPARDAAKKMFQAHHADFYRAHPDAPYKPSLVSHPAVVRGRPLELVQAGNGAASLVSRSDGVRVATLGQTFLDMLLRPSLCGGMGHVLDVWTEHAEAHLEDIVKAVNAAPTAIAKVRAGYILSERLKISHSTVESWKALSQRGGSRVLDPDHPFAPIFSETWMLSLNV